MKDNISTYSSFLENKNFVQWRLLREEESEKYWLTFIKENPELEEEFNKAIVICDNIRINEKIFSDTDFLYQRILQSISIHRKNKQRRNVIYSLYAAAVIALLLITSTLFIFNKDTSAALNERIIGSTLPDEHITLITDENITTLNQHAVIRLADGRLSYTDSTNTIKYIEVGASQTNILNVPNGKRSSIVLADGSEIWINSGTKLFFPSVFNEKTREITVEGEIFIHVAKSEQQPFIVHTPKFAINVQGTRFNVSTYKDDSEHTVVLVNGSININAPHKSLVPMTPNEMVIMKNDNLTKKVVDVSHYTGWIDGILIFDATPTSEMLKKIGRYYNISFDGVAELADKKITGKLFLSENIDNVLSSISLLTSTEYKRDNNVIKLIKNERSQ